MSRRQDNRRMLGRLAVIAAVMFGFGYALVPMYRAICEATGLNILARGENAVASVDGSRAGALRNTQVDTSRTITVIFDANARGAWSFHPEQSSVQVHPGALTTVMYEFQNNEKERTTAQAIPSYAPRQAAAHFHKIECFCFSQWTLNPGEKKVWPVVFVIDPKLPKDVTSITLSYTFFEVGAKTPPAPEDSADAGTPATRGAT
ncbi:MAG: Cytochrome oxidase biogenesis protein Cox11-CtaG, copper delivery to Cox1 [Burkholderiaceae bacterium]|jgi:cytochrome c oxidase assembly protein subunit 11|nr:MAG: Cytochrome oxidase biogenesis protein Cox11-CtaG, copper delivery to Cox1 [Burkholderiaceae bacterium]